MKKMVDFPQKIISPQTCFYILYTNRRVIPRIIIHKLLYYVRERERNEEYNSEYAFLGTFLITLIKIVIYLPEKEWAKFLRTHPLHKKGMLNQYQTFANCDEKCLSCLKTSSKTPRLMQRTKLTQIYLYQKNYKLIKFYFSISRHFGICAIHQLKI